MNSTIDIQASGRASALGSCYNLNSSSSSSKLSPSLSPHPPELRAILSTPGSTKVSWCDLHCIAQTHLSLHPYDLSYGSGPHYFLLQLLQFQPSPPTSMLASLVSNLQILTSEKTPLKSRSDMSFPIESQLVVPVALG